MKEYRGHLPELEKGKGESRTLVVLDLSKYNIV